MKDAYAFLLLVSENPQRQTAELDMFVHGQSLIGALSSAKEKYSIAAVRYIVTYSSLVRHS